MKQYFIHHSYSTSLKNKLHEAFEDFILSQNRKATPDLPALKKKIQKEVEALNASYGRCNPIILHFSDHYNTKKTIGIMTNTGVKADILLVEIQEIPC